MISRVCRAWARAAIGVAALGAFAGLAAADGVVRSEVDSRKIGLHDQVQLTITVEGSRLPDQVPMPALTNLQVVGGPSTSTQMSFVNGHMSQSRSWTFALEAQAVGRAEVGPVTVKLENGETSAPPIPIEVVAGSVKPQASPQRSNDVLDEDPFSSMFGRQRQAEPRLLVEAKPSRTRLFVGEPLLLTYYIYTQIGVTGLQFAQAPQYEGFWAEDLSSPEHPRGEPVTVDGVPYQRFPVLMKLLFPTRVGRLTIAGSTLSIGIQRLSFFDNGGVVQRSTKPVSVEVRPIPDAPGLSGAVGRFRAEATVDRPSLALGDAATLRFKVQGSGNLKWIDRAPEVTVPGTKVYPPQIKSDFKASPAGVVGSRTWEFVIVPQTSGTLEIPSLSFSYFDPSKERIERSETAPIPLRVGAGAPGASPPVPISATAPALRGGPLPLRADLELRSASSAFSGRAVALAAALALLLHGLLWGSGRLGQLRLGGPRQTAAPRSTRSALRDLERIGRDGMSKEKAAGLIEKTIHSVFGSLDGQEDERARAVRDLLDEVHSVRYAPQLGDYSEKLRELAARAVEVVRRWA